MTKFSRAFAAFAGALIAGSCSNSTASSGPPATITKVSGDDQSAVVSTALAQPFVIKVADTSGIGVPNVAVVWTLTQGSGTLTVAKAKTDGNGKAQASLTIGTGAGTRIASVVVSAITKGTNNAAFVAIAAAPQTRDDWITYGHDAHRTSASQASMKSPLTTQWRFAPPSPVTNPYTIVFDALAAADGVYLQWGSTGTFFGFGTGTDVDRISPAGARVWSNTSWGADYNIGHWGSIYGNKFVYEDDGLGYLNLSSGTRAFNTGVDWWGETLPDSTGALYVSQNWHVDGPQTFVGSLSATGTSRWKTNLYGATKADIGVWDPSGGLAMNNGVLFFDPVYQGSIVPPNPKGVFAFTAATGALLKFVATTPNSHISADSTKVYLVETNATTLVARAQSDLHVVWSATIPYAGPQAPLLANGLVIVGTNSDIEAFNAVTGVRVWKSTVAGLTTYSQGSTTTYLAAALGSGTLIATASNGIHVLSLLTGVDQWRGVPTGASGTAHDPVIVNDPVNGPVLYVVDNAGVIALKGAP